MKLFFKLLLITLIITGCAVNKNISTQPNFAAENYFLLGQTAMQQRDLESAIQLYKKAISADANSIFLKETLIQTLAVKSLYDESAYSEVLEYSKKYCEENVNSETIYSLAAESYFKEQQYDMAEKCFRKAIKIKPTMRNQTAYYLFQHEVKTKADSKLLKKAIALPWDEAELVLTIAELYNKIDSVRSMKIYDQAYQKWNDEASLTPLLTYYEKLGSQDKVLELIQHHIDNGKSLSDPIKTYLIGRYFLHEKYESILKNKKLCLDVGSQDILKYLFFSAVHIDSVKIGIEAGIAIEESGEIPQEFQASFYTYFADLYLSDNNFAEAVTYLIKANDVNTIQNYMFNVDLSKNAERKEKIYKLLQQYLQTLEDKSKAYYLLGIYHTETEEKEVALSFLDQLSESFINENELNLLVAFAYLQNSMDIPKARELVKDVEGIDITPNELIAGLLMRTEYDSIAYFILKEEIKTNPKPDVSTFTNGSFLGEKYDTPDSLLITLEKGIELYPENADLLNAGGYFIAKYEFEEKYDEAEVYLEKAVLLQPESEMIWDSLAWLYFKQNKFNEALKAMEVPLSKEINNSEIAYHLGEIYLKLNKIDKAKYYLNLAVKMNNEIQSVQLSIELLEKFKGNI